MEEPPCWRRNMTYCWRHVKEKVWLLLQPEPRRVPPRRAHSCSARHRNGARRTRARAATRGTPPPAGLRRLLDPAVPAAAEPVEMFAADLSAVAVEMRRISNR